MRRFPYFEFVAEMMDMLGGEGTWLSTFLYLAFQVT